MSTKDDDEKSDKFYKRIGTTDLGRYYEDIRTAQIAINLLVREDIEHFQIWSNDKNYGSFDDVIAIVDWTSKRSTKVAIQLKYKTKRNKRVTRDDIASSNGDFGILKYFKDYQETVKLKPQLADYILLLQTNVQITDNREIQLTDDLIIQPEPVTNDLLGFLLGNNAESKPLRFNVKTSERSDEYFTIKEPKTKTSTKVEVIKYPRKDFEDFLKKFYYYPQQPNVEKTKTLCAQVFKQQLHSNKYKKFLDFVQDWSRKEGNKLKLTKDLVSAKIAESLLSPYIRFYPNLKVENACLFMKAIDQFDVTLIDEENATKLGFLWNEDVLKMDNDFVLQPTDQKELQKILWHMHGRPLIVTLSSDNIDTVTKAFSLCQACSRRRKFIFVTNGQVPNLPGGQVFQNFEDLRRKDLTLFESIGGSLKISLEGKEAIPLNEIFGNENVRRHLTPSHFLQMLQGSLLIGEVAVKLSECYIRRSITEFKVDFKYVNEMDIHKNVALICGSVDFPQIQTKFPNIRDWSTVRLHDNNPQKVYFDNNPHDETVFEEICIRYDLSKYCVCLNYAETLPAFNWLGSTKIDPELHKYCRMTVPEEHITEECTPLHIICNGPGMGKSWFLKTFKLSYPSKMVIYIEPKNHRFPDKNVEIEKYEYFLLSVAFKKKNTLDEAVFQYLYSEKRVVILWDGLDEASPEKLPNILNAIEYFKSIGVLQFIASREQLREELEQRFTMLSRKFEILDEIQQEDYIKRRLRNNGPNINSCGNISKRIMSHLKPEYVNKLFGIPLELFMLTELFLDPASNILEKLTGGLFSIATLYQHFLDGKVKFHEQEKIGWTPQTTNDSGAALLLKNRKSLEKDFEKAAVHALYSSQAIQQMKGVDLSCDVFLDDIVANGDKYGIITSVIKKNPKSKDKLQINFAHYTYGEFLSARYFAKNHEKFKGDGIEYFLYPNSIHNVTSIHNIRLFFDLMMAEDSELHLAVLYKDVEKIKRLPKTPECKDRLGKNPSTLAATWGNYKWRKYILIPDSDEHAMDAHDYVELPTPLPVDDVLAEIYGLLENTYEADEKDKFLFLAIASCYDGSTVWRLVEKELFECIPGPTYVEGDGFPSKVVAVSNIPSFDEIATRCLFDGAKAKWGKDSSTSTTSSS